MSNQLYNITTESINKIQKAPPNKTSQGGHIYFYETDNNVFKIGYSSYPAKRLSDIRIMAPVNHNFYVSRYYTNVPPIERLLHKELDIFRIKGEWFNIDIVTKDTIFSLLEMTLL